MNASAPRLPRVEREQADAAQIAVLDELLAARGKPGGRLANLYAMMLHRPEVARRMGAIGAYCRFEVRPSELAREAAIIAVCHAHDFVYEIAPHEEIARARGMPDDWIKALRALDDAALPPEISTGVRFVRAAATGPVADDLVAAVIDVHGRDGLIDLTAIAAHYTALAVYDRVLRPVADPPGMSLGKPSPASARGEN